MTVLTIGIGFTVIVKKVDIPVHVIPELVNSGVTVMVAVIGAVVVLVAWKERMSPVPLVARPMEVLVLVQL